jgi:hypothetical protein
MDRSERLAPRSAHGAPQCLRPAGADQPTRESRWYVARDARNALLEVRALPAGSHLKRVFVAAVLEWIAAGWQLGGFSSRGGSVFFTCGAERCMVGIEAADPGQPVGYGAVHLVDSPTRPCR